MGIKERKQRQKDDTRSRIVDAALKIGREEGWAALSMRKIGEQIEYSAPVVYEHFASKDALLLELTRIGFRKLIRKIEATGGQTNDPVGKIEAMWFGYWNFAFAEKEFYQLMFGIETNCSCNSMQLPEAALSRTLMTDAIRMLVSDQQDTGDKVSATYYTFWSVVHGLISLNMIGNQVPDRMNDQVLSNALSGIIDSIGVT